MEILIGIGCTVAFIAGLVFMFFGALGSSHPAFVGGFGLSVGGVGFALNAVGVDFYIAMVTAIAVVAGGVIWFFKK